MTLNLSVLFKVLSFTIFQAIISSLFAVAIGLLGAPGYASLGWSKKMMRLIFLFPQLLSPILVVLCLLVSIPKFPYGFAGIIIGHIFLNVGLATVWLGEACSMLESRWHMVGKTLGTSPLKFQLKVMLPLLKPQIFSLFAVVFSFCLSSFAIPLVLGGGPKYSTLEVLIFESVHANGDTHSAILIGFLQCLIQGITFYFLLKFPTIEDGPTRLPDNQENKYVPKFITFAILLLILWPLAQLGITGFSQLFWLRGQISEPLFISAVKTSTLVCFGVGLLTSTTLAICLVLGWPKILIKTPSFSGVAVGVLFLLIFGFFYKADLLFLATLTLGHFLVGFFSIFRLTAPTLSGIRQRFSPVLRQMGTPGKLSWKAVYRPTSIRVLLSAGALASLWSLGEFSLTSILAPSGATLPLLIQDLLGSYRLEQASACSFILLMASFLVLALFEVLNHGLG